MVATAPDNKLDDLLWYVMPNFVRLAHGVSDEEFARAKVTLKTQILASWDGDVATGEQMAQQITSFGRVMSLNEMMARVDALTMDDIKAAANEVINDQDHALAAIGGIHELPDYNWIRRHSYMLRY
jgi:processing peptidase subunit beta